MTTKHYFNLTNGIEALEHIDIDNNQYGVIRIQSSWCERKEWLKILQDLDYDFLLNLAIGNECIVYDYGAKKDTSRAIYQGIEWIKYTLNRFWFDIIPNKVYVNNKDSTKYFEHEYEHIFL